MRKTVAVKNTLSYYFTGNGSVMED